MRVLQVCSEIYPLLKTGGLADVAGSLPQNLVKLGVDIRVLLPGFPEIINKVVDKKLVVKLPPKFDATAINIYSSYLPNSNIYVYIIDAIGLYDRIGNPYLDSNNQPYLDNYHRFALLSYVAAQLADGLDKSWRPQVIHGHDWHAGLIGAYLRAKEIVGRQKLASFVFTIHNLAYQGVFPQQVFEKLDLPSEFFALDGLEFYGQVSFMKAGIFFADKITTVSPTYAAEIQSIEQGCGLDGLLLKRQQDLSGIINGVDLNVWNPKQDDLVIAKYSKTAMAGKLKCKSFLQEQLGLKLQNDAPVFGIVSRLTEQKGLNLVLDGIAGILKYGGQVVILGSGDTTMENAFKALAKAHPQSIAVQIGFDEVLAHKIIAGSDVILVPSRFEPCGLTQLYGLLYGTLPLVHRVGGLADTVIDCSLENIDDDLATGFVFGEFNLNAYLGAIRRVFAVFKRKMVWKQVQKKAMEQNVSWEGPAQEYLALYNQLT